MQETHEHMMQGLPVHILSLWAALGLGLVALAGLIYLLARSAPAKNISLPELASKRKVSLASFEPTVIDASGSAVDTVFLLPDISNYTRFMTGSQFSFAHAQHIVFSLVNVMIETATRQVALSKLEGDAALFFTDAGHCSAAELGQTVMDVFQAFFEERRRLERSNICPCHACRHIGILDLKMFVHQGPAARFQFRGSIDLFGSDVVVLHRIMKNSVNSQRYIMVTDAAADSIFLPKSLDREFAKEVVEHFGDVHAAVYKLDDADIENIEIPSDPANTSTKSETLAKLRENLRSITR